MTERNDLDKIPQDDETQIVTVRIPKTLLKAYDDIRSEPSRAEGIRVLVEKFVAASGGKVVAKTVNYDSLKLERIRLMKFEDTLSKILNDIEVDRGLTAFRTMKNFAIKLGTDRSLCINIDEVLKKLKSYEPTKNDRFNASDLESFVEYVEAVLARRKIEAAISKLRRDESKSAS